jgi:hypothetical protein
MLCLHKFAPPDILFTVFLCVCENLADAPVRRNEHVRHCSILYYLEDGTIQVSALRQCSLLLFHTEPPAFICDLRARIH